MSDKHMPHTHSKAFYPKPLSFSNKLFFDIGNILIIIQPECDKTVQKAYFDLKSIQSVRF